jgi:hypothetical protein
MLKQVQHDGPRIPCPTGASFGYAADHDRIGATGSKARPRPACAESRVRARMAMNFVNFRMLEMPRLQAQLAGKGVN